MVTVVSIMYLVRVPTDDRTGLHTEQPWTCKPPWTRRLEPKTPCSPWIGNVAARLLRSASRSQGGCVVQTENAQSSKMFMQGPNDLLVSRSRGTPI